MPKLPPLDTLSKIVGILVSLITVITLIASALGIGPLLQASTSNSSTVSTSAYTLSKSGNMTTFTSTAGFRIEFPIALSSWTPDNYSSNTRIITIYLSGEHMDHIDCFITTGFIGQNVSFQDIINVNRESDKSLKDYQWISEGNTTLGGEPAYKMVLSSNASSLNPGQNLIVKHMSIFGVHNGTEYHAVYTALPSDYDALLPQAQHIIDSFRYTHTTNVTAYS